MINLKIDSSGLAALIMAGIAIGGIIGPIFSTWIQEYYKNKNDDLKFKEKQYDTKKEIQSSRYKEKALYIKEQLDVFNGYFQSTSQILSNPSEKNKELQSKYYGLILLYLTDEEIDTVKNCQTWVNMFLDNSEINNPASQVQSLLTSLAPVIRDKKEQLLKELEQD